MLVNLLVYHIYIYCESDITEHEESHKLILLYDASVVFVALSHLYLGSVSTIKIDKNTSKVHESQLTAEV